MTTPIEPRRATNLPKVWPHAWHGAIGEAVYRISPSTEADPIAILASLLALVGAMAGDGPHVQVGGVRHPARIWPLIVGRTGEGRKGTSWAEARRFAALWGTYGQIYVRRQCIGGLTSGEGLIAQLGGTVGAGKDRDAAAAEVAAPDGRLTVLETEFARVLTSSKRDGSTLGPVLRQLWEDGDAGIMTRTNPLRVEGAHLCVVGHITSGELRLRLAESDLVGGTLNRFLLIASRRPHLLPHEVPRHDISEQAEWLAKMLDRARFGGPLHRDRAAEDLWREVYHALNQDEPDGQLGSVLARGPVYTMRLALAYALADGAGAIAPDHLLAALAVWHYSARSARLVFPAGVRSTSDLEKLSQYLSEHSEGVTRSNVSELFARNKTAAELDGLLTQLVERKVATAERDEARSRPGRPALRYRSTGRSLDPMAQILGQNSR